MKSGQHSRTSTDTWRHTQAGRQAGRARQGKSKRNQNKTKQSKSKQAVAGQDPDPHPPTPKKGNMHTCTHAHNCTIKQAKTGLPSLPYLYLLNSLTKLLLCTNILTQNTVCFHVARASVTRRAKNSKSRAENIQAA